MNEKTMINILGAVMVLTTLCAIGSAVYNVSSGNEYRDYLDQASKSTHVDYDAERERYLEEELEASRAEVARLVDRYEANDVYARHEYCYAWGGFHSNDPVSCMEAMRFVKHENHRYEFAEEYFSPLDWEIRTKCNQTDGIDSALCPLIIGR